jgi:hypothetical protein
MTFSNGYFLGDFMHDAILPLICSVAKSQPDRLLSYFKRMWIGES